MDVYGTLDGGVGGVGIHDVEEAVDGFVAADAEERGAEDALGFGVDQDLHEAEAFAFFEGAVDAGHGAGGDEDWLARFACVGFRYADAGEGWVAVHGVAGYAVGDSSGVVVEEVCGDDFEVVVGGVSEGAAAVAVAEGVDAGDVGAELIVNEDVAVFVCGDASTVEAEVLRVGGAPDGEEDVGAGDGRVVGFGAGGAGLDTQWMRGEVDAFGVEVDGDAFGFEDAEDAGGDVFVFVGGEARAFLDDGDLGAEAAVHLGELDADVAAADDEEVLGEDVEGEEGGVGEVGDGVDAGEIGDGGSAAYVEEDLVGGEGVVVDLHGGG